jgi:signal transduction histidine kinase/ligand-binding sensor domain-containing protein
MSQVKPITILSVEDVQRWRAITQSLWLASLLFFIAPSVCALDPNLYISQYSHTAWRVRDGYFSSAPLAIAQTQDGRLWIGGESGLLQFDGVRFVPWTPPDNSPLPGNRIFNLLGTRDGSLWIGTDKGLARWKNNQLTAYATYGRFIALMEDRNGAVWAGHTRDLGMLPPLCRFAGDQFNCFGESNNPYLLYVGSLYEDRSGNIWVGGAGGVCRWQEAHPDCYEIPGQAAPTARFAVWALADDANGDLWVDGGPSGIWRLASGHWQSYQLADLKLHSPAFLRDRENSLWIGDAKYGLIRRVNGRTDRFTRADGFSGDSVNSIFEDREGSVWVATNDGLDRLRELKVVSLTAREGLPMDDSEAVLASRDGSIWVTRGSEATSIVQLKEGKFTTYLPGGNNGLPRANLGSLFEDSQGLLWVGVGTGVVWREHDRFHPIAMPKRCGVSGAVRAFAEDVDGTIWFSTTDPECALVGVRDHRVTEAFPVKQLGGQIVSMAADPAGGVWLGFANPGLRFYRNGNFESHSDKFSGAVRTMLMDSRGLWAATNVGLTLYKAGRMTVFGTANGLPCDDLDSVIKDDSDALWLKGSCGLVQATRFELDAWLKDPNRRFQLRVLDASDGAQAGRSPFSASVTKSIDGRLWWAIERGGVQVFNPAHFVNNLLPPPIRITTVTADGKSYQVDSALQLPALTQDLEIQYTAYSLAVPEKVRFRYRLEGAESNWQEAGGRREAHFAKLKPGTYRFIVIAANNDGVWNDQGTSLTFVVPPAFYQTNWFLFLCIACGGLAVWAIYHLRVKQIARAISVRFNERLAERVRIARELHDTLLQTVQGSKLVADHALSQSNDSAGMRRAMEQLSGWLGQATQEGRAALNSLRTSTEETNDLAACLRRATEECFIDSPIAVSFSVIGDKRDMHPIARDEIYRIGYESIRNACEHSSASKLEIILTYAHDLTLRVSDNGIGMEPDVLMKGREGHFGLRGMRERADRIRSKFTLVSSPNSGTVMTLVVPGNIIFRKTSVTRFERIKTFFGFDRVSVEHL